MLQRENLPHTDKLHVPLEIIYTHDTARRREYQFPSRVIFPPAEQACKTMKSDFNSKEIEYGKRLMNVCMEMVCACCVLSRIKTLERERLMMAGCELEWSEEKFRQQMSSRTLKLGEGNLIFASRIFSNWDKTKSINQNLIGIKERFRKYENHVFGWCTRWKSRIINQFLQVSTRRWDKLRAGGWNFSGARNLLISIFINFLSLAQ